jgi:alpha-N-arabinofuranosidase
MTRGSTPRGRTDVHLHTEHRIARVDERIFGGFLEHMGRAVYEGVFDPGSPLSDERGFRLDVLDALAPLRMPVVRYPGGNFVSSYDWRDGVGPHDRRPRRPDFAWKSIETNRFGTDEFLQWCDALGTSPMLAVNLGTGTPADAAALLEYCNLPAGTSVADQRVANGRHDPYGVELWCLGNEMDGFWQAGHVPAETYAERALVASRLMKGLDPTITTIACGSSNRMLPTYLEWDRKVLEHCWDSIDLLSVHRYSANRHDDTASFLAEGVVIDQTLDEYRGLLSYVRGRKRDGRDVRLCFDEWNVWYREMSGDGGWTEAPHLLEERYNLEDALVCAQFLNSFVRNADVVAIACIAQIVNVIAPVLTRADGLLVQSIWWPFRLLRDAVAGEALHCSVRGPELTTRRGDVPALDVAATFDEASGTGSVSIVNRSPAEAAEVAVHIADRTLAVTDAVVLQGDPKAINDWDAPDVVAPAPIAVRADGDGTLRLTAPAPSHVVIRLGPPPSAGS